VQLEHRFCPSCAEPLTHRARQSDPFLSQVIAGNYLVRELIGEGGMGRVYRAEQVALGKSVAIKVIHGHLIGDESAVARFYTEAKASSRLNHPNCVAVIDFGKTDGGQLYIVMEYLRGKDLGRILTDEGALPAARVAEICRQVCAALADAHELGIVHRDLKPDNVLVEPLRTGGDFVKVVDFGLAKIQTGPTRDRPITSAGIVCGTPEYMSPEQGRGDELDGRSDLYGLGVVLYECLTGSLPFTADSPTQVVLRHLSETAEHPRTRAPDRDIPEELCAVVLRAMEKDRTKRYQSAEEMAAALDEWLALARHQMSGRICPSCGRVNPIAARFCAVCGARIVVEAVTPALGTAPTISLPASDVREPPPPRGLTVPDLRLVGSEKALAALLTLRERAAIEGAVARLVGEHGVGKRRLAEELLTRAAAEGDFGIVTGPDPTWAQVSYFAVRRLVAGLLGLRVDVTAEDAMIEAERRSLDLEAIAGVWEIFSAKGRDDLAPEVRVRAAGAALRATIELRTRDQRVLVVAEDLDRCDALSRGAFSTLARLPHVPRLLLLAMHRPGFDPGWPNSTSLDIVGLPTSHARLLLARRSAGMTPPPSLPGTLAARDAVPPLYVDQLVRFLQEGGVSPPDTLPDLVSARVGRLPPEARILLQCAAILGASSNRIDLSKVAGGEVDLDAGLGILKDRAILIEEGDVIRFGHPLIADLVAAGIPSSARKELHARAADALAGRGAPLEVRAHHAQRTDGGFSALLLLERAGNHAARRGDREAAVEYFRRGLELARQEISRGEITEPEKPMLMFSAKLGRALLAAGQSLRADAVVSEALGMGLGGASERAELLTVLADIAVERGRMKAAVAHAKEAVEAGARMPRAGSRANLQMALGRTLLRSGDPAGAGIALGEALQTLGEAAHSSNDDRALRAEALLLLAESQSTRGAAQIAAASAGEALRLAEAGDLRPVMGRCLLRLGACAKTAGDRAVATKRFQEAADLFEALGDGLAAHEARQEALRAATPG